LNKCPPQGGKEQLNKERSKVTQYQKVNLTLPPETVSQLRAVEPNRVLLPSVIVALRANGWTLESIAEPLGMSRENIRLIAQQSDLHNAISEAKLSGFIIPTPPLVVVKPKVERAKPLPENIARLKELQPFAQQVRANVTRYREEAEEYTRLLNHEHVDRGVSVYRLAKELGVTHGALRFRLVRYGYKTTDSISKVYRPIREVNRAI